MRRTAGLAAAAAIWLGMITSALSQNVVNGSFETPALSPNTFLYDPNGATWTFTANAGILNSPGGGFLGPPAPDGSQYAFLQSASSPGAVSQTIDFSLSGTYLLSYLVAGRSDNEEGALGDLSYQILLDSAVIATDATTTAQSFTSRMIQFTADAGSHTLTFVVSPGVTGDNTAFFDSVALAQVPEPDSLFLLLTFAPLLLLTRAVARRGQ